ncbi:MAG: TonB-dependent receptor [Myxococcales bacterium]|nr:TonB-dependent receptor [Myxococcales bacterium]
MSDAVDPASVPVVAPVEATASHPVSVIVPPGMALTVVPISSAAQPVVAPVRAGEDLTAGELAQLSGPSARPAVLVTGSLIERASQTSPSLLTILTRDDLLAAGRTMVGDILKTIPEQGNAINAQVNNGGDGSTAVSLRGLGADRTLVLLNGRRFVPVGTGADSVVDLNTIPLALIDRVEILKEGASPVYGSGAIGGVVNIITRTSFTGTEASLYTGESERGDGFTYDASFISGHRAAGGRGHAVFSAGVQRQDAVFAGDRAFSQFDKTFNFESRTELIGGSTSIPGGRLDATSIDIDGDGVPDPLNICGEGVRFCTSNGVGGFRPFIAPQDLYNFQPENYLYTPSSRFNAYTAGHHKIGSTASVFFEASYLHRESDQRLAPEPFASAATISRDSIFNPFGGDVFSYNRRLEEFGPRTTSQKIDTLRTVVGLQGGIPDDVPALEDWKWELSYNLGRSAATSESSGNLILSRLQNAIGPSFIDFNGRPTCGTPFAPILDGCVPMNILGASGSISPDAVAYTEFNGQSSGVDEQHTVLATAHGRVARLPNGGDISAAVTADFRKQSGSFTPDALISTGDTTGNFTAPIDGSFSVIEAAAEVQVVAARDRNGLERLELDLASRVFRYESFAGVNTSARALLRPVRGLTLRTSYAASFREPTIPELFQAGADTFPSATDPCDTFLGPISPAAAAECERQGVPANADFGTFQQRVITRGNPDVDPETAMVLTAGAVVEPAGVPGLALSVNYWNIELRQQIQQASISTIFDNCYERGIQSFCDQVHRDPFQGGAIDFVDSPTTNIGSTLTSGVDVAVVYNHDARRAGKLRLRADAQRLLNFDVDTGSAVLRGLDNYDLGVFPTLKANLSAAWQHPRGAGAGVNVQFVGGFLECDGNDCNGGELSRDVAPYTKVDLFGSYALGSARRQTLLTVGVNNVLDRDPSLIYIGFAGDSDASTYDYLGRFFYARLTQQF